MQKRSSLLRAGEVVWHWAEGRKNLKSFCSFFRRTLKIKKRRFWRGKIMGQRRAPRHSAERLDAVWHWGKWAAPGQLSGTINFDVPFCHLSFWYFLFCCLLFWLLSFWYFLFWLVSFCYLMFWFVSSCNLLFWLLSSRHLSFCYLSFWLVSFFYFLF